MTGDKILNLNPKISPSYAKVSFKVTIKQIDCLSSLFIPFQVQRRQLPPNTEIEQKTNHPKAFENFPSQTFQKRKRSQNPSEVSVSNSENILANNNGRYAGSTAVSLMNVCCNISSTFVYLITTVGIVFTAIIFYLGAMRKHE